MTDREKVSHCLSTVQCIDCLHLVDRLLKKGKKRNSISEFIKFTDQWHLDWCRYEVIQAFHGFQRLFVGLLWGNERRLLDRRNRQDGCRAMYPVRQIYREMRNSWTEIFLLSVFTYEFRTDIWHEDNLRIIEWYPYKSVYDVVFADYF